MSNPNLHLGTDAQTARRNRAYWRRRRMARRVWDALVVVVPVLAGAALVYALACWMLAPGEWTHVWGVR